MDSSNVIKKMKQIEGTLRLTPTPSGSTSAQVTGKGLSHFSANISLRNKFQSTPRFGSPAKRLNFSDDCSPITRKARRCEIVKVLKLVDAFVQTDSKCDCDFYDENGLEMMASNKAEPNYYGNLAGKIRPEVESIQKKNEQLTNNLEKKRIEVSELQTTVDVLHEVIDDYTEGEEAVVGSTKDTTPTLSKNDSGVEEHETSVESIVENMKTSDKAVGDANASKVVTTSQTQSNIQSSHKSASAELKYKNKMTNSKYVQASTCCTCDLTDEEQIGMMVREEKNELDHLYDVSQMRMTLVSTREINEVLETQVAEEDEKLHALQLLRNRLLNRAENAELLSNMCNPNSYLCDSGFANETDSSHVLNASTSELNASTSELNASISELDASTSELNTSS